MFFVIVGNNKSIAQKELESQGYEPNRIKKNIALLEKDPTTIKWGSVIKAGKIISLNEVKEVPIIGTNDKTIGKVLKKNKITKRFKMVDIDHQDKEVKLNGIEVINLGNKINESARVGIVEYYQDIPLFEVIDFEKPLSGMTIGMMPSKLALTLINIGTGLQQETEETTVYDPFAGFGTTCWLANHLGYNTIGSDIKITAAKQNLKRWKQHEKATQKHITLFKHDVFNEFQKPFTKKTTCVVTEGWLGPIQKNVKPEQEAKEIQLKVGKVYEAFLRHAHSFLNKGTVLVFTVPFYVKQTTNIIYFQLQRVAEELEIGIEALDEVYKRKKQFIGRQIVIVQL